MSRTSVAIQVFLLIFLIKWTEGFRSFAALSFFFFLPREVEGFKLSLIFLKQKWPKALGALEFFLSKSGRRLQEFGSKSFFFYYILYIYLFIFLKEFVKF